MSTVTLSTGTAGYIIGNIVYGTTFWDERFNQIVQQAADGSDIVYDNGPTVCHGTIIAKNVSKANGDSFRTWVLNNAIYSLNTFSISALVGVNWGNGDNTAITTARYDGVKDTKGLLELEAPGVYTITFPYKFVR